MVHLFNLIIANAFCITLVSTCTLLLSYHLKLEIYRYDEKEQIIRPDVRKDKLLPLACIIFSIALLTYFLLYMIIFRPYRDE